MLINTVWFFCFGFGLFDTEVVGYSEML